MTASAWVLLAVACALAVGDWIAVAPRVSARAAEYLLKPATTVALIGVAVALRPEDPSQRSAFVVALILSLAGDVFLMLPRDAFVEGLGAFLLAHLAYVAGFALAGVSGGLVALGAGIVVLAAGTVGARIVRGVRESHRKLTVPVALYMSVISAMVILGVGSGSALAAAGALLFYCSDALIAWNRFVRPLAWARPAIMATYHLAQAGLVLSLVR